MPMPSFSPRASTSSAPAAMARRTSDSLTAWHRQTYTGEEYKRESFLVAIETAAQSRKGARDRPLLLTAARWSAALALKVDYEDWGHWLSCDRAVAVQTEAVGAPIPYTRSIARQAGWQWRIPLQHRAGNGMVFSSRHWSDDEATPQLLGNVEGKLLTEPRVIPFGAGQRRAHWRGNCVAMGLASGFIEPLESTSIHLIQRSLIRLMQMFPYDGIREPDVREFNSQMRFEVDNVRDFIVLHYHVTNRADSPFWRQCAAMAIPDSLRHRIELFRQAGRVFKLPTELFGENSWIQVMLGQGVEPEQYHPIANMMTEEELGRFLAGIHGSVQRLVNQLPEHQRFIDYYCGKA